MVLFTMSVPPFMGEPIERVMCDVCGTAVEEWVALRIITDLVHVCSGCVNAIVRADHEMRRQWIEWRENSDYAPR